LVLDPDTQKTLGSLELAHGPDYIRFVAATSEAWVTQPGSGRIEVVAISASGKLEHAGFVELQSGPEGIVMDETRMRADVQRSDDIVSIDIAKYDSAEILPTECGGTHGIPALAEARGFLFAGSSSAEVAVIDVTSGALKDRYQLGWAPC